MSPLGAIGSQITQRSPQDQERQKVISALSLQSCAAHSLALAEYLAGKKAIEEEMLCLDNRHGEESPSRHLKEVKA